MSKRQLLLAGATLALLLFVGSALSLALSADDGQNANALSQPVTWAAGVQNFNAGNSSLMRYGGPIEKSLRIVPPLHRKFWPPMPLFL